ncbi:MAG: DUF5666 domain-containing protein [Rubrivivax sp.]|nr:DUF5666 domain-containing protein [Rubrivivax sp.]
MLKLRFPQWPAAVAAGVAIGATALLVACGGGGDAAAPEATTAVPAAAVSYTQGAISGFGSVFVGGVRFDDSAATVTDDQGRRRDRSELRLGMMVEVDGGNVDRANASAMALRIRWGSEVVGPVDAIDAGASTLTVLGQTVLVTSSTVFDETLVGGLSASLTGVVVEVHGILDPANGRVVATRIEREDSAAAYKLRGAIANVNPTARTFTVNGTLISYASLPAGMVPPGLTNGQIVRVLLQTTAVDGAWVATALAGGLRLPEAHREAHMEGVITAFTSISRFEVNGLVCDASNASFPDGTAGIGLGARVEVEGTVDNGVLMASKVTLEERRNMGQRPLELHGEVTKLDTVGKTFALRGVTVWFGSTVQYRDGTEANLADGRRVEVKGVLSRDRTRLEARRIEFK